MFSLGKSTYSYGNSTGLTPVSLLIPLRGTNYGANIEFIAMMFNFNRELAIGNRYCCRLPTADCPLPIAVCRLPTAVCRLPSAVCPLPTAVCQLPSFPTPSQCPVQFYRCIQLSFLDCGKFQLRLKRIS